MASRLAPGGGQVPKLGLLVVDDDAMGPGQKRGHDEAHALAGAGGGDGGDMLGAVMAEVMQGFVLVAPAAGINALGFSALGGQKPGRLDFGAARPMGGAVDAFVALGAPAVHGKKRDHAEPQGRGQRRRGGAEEMGGVACIFLLPDKPLPGQIEMAQSGAPKAG